MKPNLMFPVVSGYYERVLKQKTLCAFVSSVVNLTAVSRNLFSRLICSFRK